MADAPNKTSEVGRPLVDCSFLMGSADWLDPQSFGTQLGCNLSRSTSKYCVQTRRLVTFTRPRNSQKADPQFATLGAE